MAGIGGIPTSIIRGLPIPTKETVDVWRVPGLDGYGAMSLGLGDSEFPLTSIHYVADDDAALLLVADAMALQGAVISIVDDWGDEYDDVLVVHVGQPVKTAVIGSDGSTVRVEIPWQCLTAN